MFDFADAAGPSSLPLRGLQGRHRVGGCAEACSRPSRLTPRTQVREKKTKPKKRSLTNLHWDAKIDRDACPTQSHAVLEVHRGAKHIENFVGVYENANGA